MDIVKFDPKLPVLLLRGHQRREDDLRFNPNHAPAGSPTGGQFTSGDGGGDSEIFVSPNESEGGKVGDALGALNSKAQAEQHAAALDMIQTVDHGGTVTDAVGAWQGTTENSLVVTMHTNNMDQAKYVSALLGDRAKQLGVLAFIPGEGKDSIYNFHVTASVEDVHNSLDKQGFRDHTLHTEGEGTRVYLYSQDSSLNGKMEEIGAQHDAEIHSIVGTGAFIGADSREAAHEVYGQIIRDYESKHVPYSGRYRSLQRAVSDYNGSEARKDLTRLIKSDLAAQKGFVDYRFNPNHDEKGKFSSGGDGSVAKDVPLGKTLKEVWTNPETGKYYSERLKFHQAISDEGMVGKVAAIGRAPIAYIKGGGTSSGKSSVSSKIPADINAGAVQINGDDVIAKFPESAQLKAQEALNPSEDNSTSAASRSYLEAKDVVKLQLADAQARGLDIVYDTTASNKDFPDLVASLHDQGYEVHLRFVDIPADMAIERARIRSEDVNSKDFGRKVPKDALRNAHTGAARNFELMRDSPYVKSAQLYDNRTKSLSLVYDRQAGQEGKINDHAFWTYYQQKGQGS